MLRQHLDLFKRTELYIESAVEEHPICHISPPVHHKVHVRAPHGRPPTMLGSLEVLIIHRRRPRPPQKPPNKLGYGATIKIFLKTLTLKSNLVTFAKCVLLGFLLKRLCIVMLEPFGGLHPATPDFWTTAPPSHKRICSSLWKVCRKEVLWSAPEI